jgi:hypothetical protein
MLELRADETRVNIGIRVSDAIISKWLLRAASTAVARTARHRVWALLFPSCSHVPTCATAPRRRAECETQVGVPTVNLHGSRELIDGRRRTRERPAARSFMNAFMAARSFGKK